MQLNLAGNGRKIRIDSTVEGFTEIARQVAAAAAEHDLELNHTTQSNLVSLGLREAVDPPTTISSGS